MMCVCQRECARLWCVDEAHGSAAVDREEEAAGRMGR